MDPLPTNQVERTFDEHDWLVVKFTGRESWKLYRTLVAGVFPAVADALGQVDVSEATEDAITTIVQGAGGLISAIGALAEKFSDDEWDRLTQRLLAQTMCDRVPVNKQFDTLFAGNPLLVIKAVAFVVEVNFIAPFASLFAGEASSALSKIKSAIESLQNQSSATKPTT